jgi:hypothetical protein
MKNQPFNKDTLLVLRSNTLIFTHNLLLIKISHHLFQKDKKKIIHMVKLTYIG